MDNTNKDLDSSFKHLDVFFKSVIESDAELEEKTLALLRAAEHLMSTILTGADEKNIEEVFGVLRDAVYRRIKINNFVYNNADDDIFTADVLVESYNKMREYLEEGTQTDKIFVLNTGGTLNVSWSPEGKLLGRIHKDGKYMDIPM